MPLRDNLPSVRNKAIKPPAQSVPQPTLQPVAKPPDPKPGKPPLPVIGGEPITFACGHAGDFPLLMGEKPDFTNRRREKYRTRKRCPACIQAKQDRIKAEAAERRKAKAARKMEGPGRLPDGSAFDARWDATAGRWTGNLVVEAPGTEAGCVTFSDYSTAIFKLLRNLDIKYRIWASEKEKQ